MLATYHGKPMFRRPPISTLVFALAAFSVVAMHFGMVERTMPMLGMEGSRATAQTVAVQATSMTSIASSQRSATDVRRSDSPAPSHGRHESGEMTTVMVCELLVLVTIIGFRFRLLRASRRLRPRVVAPSFLSLERPHRGLRPARPPGLTELCVANC